MDIEEKKTEIEEQEEIIDQEEKPKAIYSIPWLGLIVIGVIIILMAACIIVIGVLGGFN